MIIKSPLRYPGGKTRAVKIIEPLIPDFYEYREPFVGGGSVFSHIKQSFKGNYYWINDLNSDVFFFWKFARDSNQEFVNEVLKIKNKWTDGRQLFNYYRNLDEELSDFEKAVRFFILNRITFSGIIDIGGYSEQSFLRRFTDSSIDRLSKLTELLQETRITNFDYEDVVKETGNNVFIFLDPPYYSSTNSKLYGKNGDLHSKFDHERFAQVMSKCNHKWIITYDDCDFIRELFDFAEIIPWKLQYGMNNYKKQSAGKGKEIFISNFPINISK